jgi:hypothetical protein
MPMLTRREVLLAPLLLTACQHETGTRDRPPFVADAQPDGYATVEALIIVLGILPGVFTAMESSAVAVIYTIVVAFFVHHHHDVDLPAARDRASAWTWSSSVSC